jgi:RimJ/RimL family protein N-acetyltransferase
MTAPHETPIPGPAAVLAAELAARLPQPVTPRLRLRAPRLGDAGPWADILTGPAGPHLGGPFTRDEAFTEFAATVGLWLLRGHGLWTVEPRDGGAVLGFVLVGFEPGDREPELGMLFLPAAEGRGYAQEAATAAREHAFGAAGLPALVSYIDPANQRSRRLAARLGAVPDGMIDGAEVWRHRPGAA